MEELWNEFSTQFQKYLVERWSCVQKSEQYSPCARRKDLPRLLRAPLFEVRESNPARRRLCVWPRSRGKSGVHLKNRRAWYVFVRALKHKEIFQQWQIKFAIIPNFQNAA